ncbi:hypothetical protein IMZ48_35900, partial [Candidatus Bathyarchaeota archaeon]|nr:hypothetical protein [Candidatus Bathyarchaeota archaeon]
MPSDYKETEQRIQAGVAYHATNPGAAIRFIAQKFDVPYSRLYGRLRGRKTRTERPGNNNKALTDADEALICRIVDGLSATGQVVRPDA